MRNSPAFTVVQQLPRSSQVKTQNRVDRKRTTDGKNYFHIAPKQTEYATFILGGVAYQSDLTRIPHLSVYEKFEVKERSGLSVFHFTDYAFCEEVIDQGPVAAAAAGGDMPERRVRHQVVIHVYFSQTGAHLSSQIKKESAQAEQGGAAAMAAASAASTSDVVTLTPVEEAALRRHALQQVGPAISEILQQVHQQADQARQKTDRGVAALESMPLRNPQERAAYLRKVKLCIRDLEALNAVSFTRSDSRLLWMRTLVASRPDQQAVSVAAASSSAALFSEPAAAAAGKARSDSDSEDEVAASAASAATRPRPKPATAQQRASDLKRRITAQIKAVDERLQALEADAGKDEVAKAIEKHRLLQDKIPLIAEGGKHIFDGVVQRTFQAIHAHHGVMQALFKEKAIAGDLDAVKALIAFVDDIDADFFIDFVLSNHVEVIEYVIQHFDESIIFLNQYAYPLSDEGAITQLKNIPLMYKVITMPDGLPLFRMLLQCGADPNFTGDEGTAQIGSLLSVAASQGLVEHARALLLHGASLYPQLVLVTEKVVSNLSARQVKSQNAQLVRQFHQARRHGRLMGTPLKSMPFDPIQVAITAGQEDIVKLFIEFGIDLSRKLDQGFDALGAACCVEGREANQGVVGTLLAAEVDVNAVQGNGDSALGYQVERNNYDIATLLSQAGASPNFSRKIPITLGQERTEVLCSIFLKAVVRRDERFVQMFLENPVNPVDVYSFVAACGFYFSPGHFRPSIDVLKLEVLFDKRDLLTPLDPIAQLLVQHMEQVRANPETLAAAVQSALDVATEYKSHKLFAVRFYMVALLFGDEGQRHTACFNIAVCLEAKRDLRVAQQFYQLAGDFRKGTGLSRQAKEGVIRVLTKTLEQSPAMVAASGAAAAAGALRP